MTGAQVTVLMPTRDDAATLGETLRSLASQTHKGWDLVVVDDSTDDGTENVLERFVAEHAGQVRHIRGPGRGQLAALAAVSELADGDFITLLHSDDVLVDPGAFDRLTRTLARHGADGAYGDLVLLDERGRVAGRQRSRLSPGLVLALGGSNTIPDFFFLTREAFIRYAIPNYLTWNMPYYFTVDAGGLRLPRLLKLNDPWYGYRIHAGQYASSPAGLFDKTNGELRTLVTAHAAGLFVHPPEAHASPRLARMMASLLDVRRAASTGLPLRQLARAVARKRATISRISADPTLRSYLARALASIDDLRVHQEGRSPGRPLRLDAEAVRGLPTYSGHDAPQWFRELRAGSLPRIVAGLFAKEFDAVIALDGEAFAWISAWMRFLAYATPVLLGDPGEELSSLPRFVNSKRPQA